MKAPSLWPKYLPKVPLPNIITRVLWFQHMGVPTVAQCVQNLTGIHKYLGLIPGLLQWVKGSGIAMSYSVGCRAARIWHCCGVGQQLQLWFHPERGNIHMSQVWPKKAKLFLKNFYYSWFTMFCQFLLYNKVTHLYIYVHSFPHIIPIMFHHR